MFTAPGQLESTLSQMDRGRAMRRELLMDAPPRTDTPYAQPLLDAVALFDELGVGYALVGGIASMYYGRARFTEDVDFVAAAGHIDVLAAHREALERHHFDSNCTYTLYHRSGVQVDLWKDAFADQIVARATEVQLAGRLVRLADPHDLIAMKLRANRLKDDYDIGQILLATPIDEKRLAGLVTEEQFAHFQEIKKRA